LGICGLPAFANETSLKAESYPLTTPLFIYTPARRAPLLMREFLRFVRSEPAQIVIDRAGFVNLRLQELPVSEQGQRLANSIDYAGDEVSLDDLKRLTQRLNGTSWVSLVFRFEQGGIRLDAHSESNVELLAQMLEQGDYDGRKLIFVGFSDSAGRASGNLRLAQRRAEAVRDAVIEAAVAVDRRRVRIEVDAFGEAMPIACDESEWGQRINRRVEVWVGQI
jgi:phosphate transport system substrate-binding protein